MQPGPLYLPQAQIRFFLQYVPSRPLPDRSFPRPQPLLPTRLSTPTEHRHLRTCPTKLARLPPSRAATTDHHPSYLRPTLNNSVHQLQLVPYPRCPSTRPTYNAAFSFHLAVQPPYMPSPAQSFTTPSSASTSPPRLHQPLNPHRTTATASTSPHRSIPYRPYCPYLPRPSSVPTSSPCRNPRSSIIFNVLSFFFALMLFHLLLRHI
jgi:hypothetical protein